MQVEGQQGQISVCSLATGGRVSNAYATYLQEGNSPGKLGLMSYVLIESHGLISKATVLGDRRACY